MGGRVGRLVGMAPAALIALAVVVVLPARPAAACSCVGWTDQQAFAEADAVFVGRVERIDGPRPIVGGSTTGAKTFRFSVGQVFKGTVHDEQVVRSEAQGASCGLEAIAVGETYLVFAGRRSTTGSVELGPGELYAGLCGGTRALAAAPLPADLPAPIPTAGPMPGAGRSPLLVPAVGLALAVAVTGAVLLVVRRRSAGTDSATVEPPASPESG